MNRRMLFGALVVLALSAPANADPMRLAQAALDLLPPHELNALLRSAGLDPIGRPVLRGRSYVLRAFDEEEGGEVRVVVDARIGEIVSVTPVPGEARRGPPGRIAAPYDPPPPGYIAPEPRRVYRSGPPTIYDDDDEEPPVRTSRRVPGPVPHEPPPVIAATPGPGAALSAPHVRSGPERGATGMLPPPPERFPQRALPPAAAKPAAPVRRTAALPRRPPLPKPRPAVDAAPMPPQAPAASEPGDSVPH